MDLFNPPKLFNYNIMIKDIDFSKFENPTIQVVWEDLSENFTQDKIKSVKYYFQKKSPFKCSLGSWRASNAYCNWLIKK